MNIRKPVIAIVGAAALTLGVAFATTVDASGIQPDWACIHEDTNHMFVWNDFGVGRAGQPVALHCEYVGLE